MIELSHDWHDWLGKAYAHASSVLRRGPGDEDFQRLPNRRSRDLFRLFVAECSEVGYKGWTDRMLQRKEWQFSSEHAVHRELVFCLWCAGFDVGLSDEDQARFALRRTGLIKRQKKERRFSRREAQAVFDTLDALAEAVDVPKHEQGDQTVVGRLGEILGHTRRGERQVAETVLLLTVAEIQRLVTVRLEAVEASKGYRAKKESVEAHLAEAQASLAAMEKASVNLSALDSLISLLETKKAEVNEEINKCADQIGALEGKTLEAGEMHETEAARLEASTREESGFFEQIAEASSQRDRAAVEDLLAKLDAASAQKRECEFRLTMYDQELVAARDALGAEDKKRQRLMASAKTLAARAAYYQARLSELETLKAVLTDVKTEEGRQAFFTDLLTDEETPLGGLTALAVLNKHERDLVRCPPSVLVNRKTRSHWAERGTAERLEAADINAYKVLDVCALYKTDLREELATFLLPAMRTGGNANPSSGRARQMAEGFISNMTDRGLLAEGRIIPEALSAWCETLAPPEPVVAV